MYSAYTINLFILEHKNYYLLLLETEYLESFEFDTTKTDFL